MEVSQELVALMANYVANVAADVTRAGANRLAQVLTWNATVDPEPSRAALNTSMQAALAEQGIESRLAERVARYLLWEADLIHFVRIATAEGSSEDYRGATLEEISAHLRLEIGLEGGELDSVAMVLADLITRTGQPGYAVHSFGRPRRSGPETSSQFLLGQRVARARLFEELGVPSAQHMNAYTQRYLKSAATDLSYIRLQQLGEQGNEVALHDVFVPPKFSPLPEPETLIDSDELLTSSQRLVILGPAGSGKSTSVRAAAGSIAAANDLRSVPFILEMRKFLAKTTVRSELFVEHLERRVTASLQDSPPEGWMQYLLMSGRAVVFFDGFDEVLDSGRRSEIRDAVRSFSSLYPSCSVVVTSRFTGYELAPFSDAEFSHAQICELSEPQVRTYADKWFGLRGMAGTGHELSAQHFLDESEKYADDIRRNPLMLGLLCSVYYSRGDIPRSLSDLYEQCASMLYEQWNTMRGIDDHGAWSKRLRPALYEVANLVLNNEEYLSEGIPEEALIRTLRRFFVKRLNLDEIDAGRSARDLAEVWAGRAWVLTAVASDGINRPRYGFVHQSFLEYFAAVYIFRKAKGAADLLRRLRSRLIYMNGWAVALLAVSTFDNWRSPGATSFVDVLVKDARHSVASERLALLRFAAALNDVVSLTGKTQRRVITAVLETYAGAVIVPETASALWDGHDETRSRHAAYRRRVADDTLDPDDGDFDLEDLAPEDRRYDGLLSTLDAESVALAIVDWSRADPRVVTVIAECLVDVERSAGLDRAAATGAFLVTALRKRSLPTLPLQSRIENLVKSAPPGDHWFGVACAFAIESVAAAEAYRVLPWRLLALNETLVQSYAIDVTSRASISGELMMLLTNPDQRPMLAQLGKKLENDSHRAPTEEMSFDTRARDALAVTRPLTPITNDEPHTLTESTVVASVALVALVREVWGEEWLTPLTDLEMDPVCEEVLGAAIRRQPLPERVRGSFTTSTIRLLEKLLDC